MNRKQTLTLLVLVVVLGAAGLWIYKQQNEGRRSGQAAIGGKLLPDFPVNDVTGITIKEGGAQVDLVKQEDLWRVKQRGLYPANFSEISDFLLKVRELKAAQTEEVGASQLPRLSLAEGQGTNSPVVVNFTGKDDKPISGLLLGKKLMQKSGQPSPFGEMGDDPGFAKGRWVKVPGQDRVALIADALASVEPKPEQWLDKTFVKIEKARSFSVDYPAAPTNSWKLTRETETGEWKMTEPKPGETLDSGKTSGLNYALSSPSFADVVTSPKPEELGLDKPTTVTVETFDNITYVFKVGQKTNDNIPMALSVAANLPKQREPGKDEKPEDKERLDKEWKEKQTKLEEKVAQEKKLENWTYLVSSWTLDPVLKERGSFMSEKKEEPKPDDPGTAGAGTNPPPAADETKP